MQFLEDMEFHTYEYITAFVFGAMGVFTAYGLTEFTGEIAVHFNSAGEPDAFMNAFPGLLFLPVLSVALYIVLDHLPDVDPLRSNYESFEDVLHLFKLFISCILTYVQALIVFWNLGYSYNITYMVIPIVFSAYYLSGVALARVEKNWFIGIRNPWTISSDEVWNRTHEKTALLMKISGILSLLALIAPGMAVWIFLVPPILTVVFSTVYSYWLYSIKEDQR